MSARLIRRRQLLQGLAGAAVALPFGSLACGPSKGGPLQVGGLPVTCKLTLPVACEAKAASNRALAPGAPRLEYVYVKYNGWPEIKESLMAGEIQAAYVLAPLVMDLADKGIPVTTVSLGHRSGAVIMVRTDSPYQRFEQLAGKRIAVPSRFAVDFLFLRKMLAQEGMTPDQVQILEHDLDYASGGSGKTARLHIYAGGGQQTYTWKNQRGFLSSPSDIRNQEFTAFVRFYGITDPKRAAISLKIRGGAHTSKNPDQASCTMMTFQAASTGATARFGKELTHPINDYVTLTPTFDAALTESRWFGLKLLSYKLPVEPASVINRLYLDNDPFEPATGKPRNQ